LGSSVLTIKKNTEALVVASKENGLKVNAEKLSTWSCLETKMQDEVTIKKLIIVTLKGWNISDIWEQI